MPTLHIHCGLHKTATTTIQEALGASAGALRRAGWLYPVTGQLEGPSAHHNIAWSMMRDRRTTPARGAFEGLGREIAGFDGHVLLSSEDFQASVAHPKRWVPLRQLADRTGREMVLIVYLREPLASLESLYLESLKHGLGDEFSVWTRAVLEHGLLRFKESEFHFDYLRLLAHLRALAGESVIVRNFHQLLNGSPIDDFASVLGLPGGVLRPGKDDTHANRRQTLRASLERFHENRSDRGITRQEMRALTLMCGESDALTLGMTRQMVAAFDRRFTSVRDRFDLPAPVYREITIERLDAMRVFSLETQLTIRRIAFHITRLRSVNEPVRPETQALAEHWRRWAGHVTRELVQ